VARKALVSDLHSNRENLYLRRDAILKRIAAEANRYSEDLTIRVYYERCGIDDEWVEWLIKRFGMRRPRVNRLARKVAPNEFARCILEARSTLLDITDDDGSKFFPDDASL